MPKDLKTSTDPHFAQSLDFRAARHEGASESIKAFDSGRDSVRFCEKREIVGKEYKIKCRVPKKEELSRLLRNLPNPILADRLMEIYNYRVEPDGFYFVDRLVDKPTAAIALRLFIDEALASNEEIRILKLDGEFQ